jgi:S-adenosylmethionine hydrolase
MTDFGTRDPYVASMKGVLASHTDAPVLDLTHEIAPFDVLEAAWFLRTVARWWPERTIFVCVVDPGVGTSRRIVAMELAGQVFLAPDNGLLTFLWNAGVPPAASSPPSPTARELRPAGGDAGVPSTFDGRDRFAPAAAAIANGLPLAELGPPIDDLITLDYEPPAYGAETIRGTIVAIDRFGNVITDIEAARVPFARFALHVEEQVIDRIERNYGDAAEGPFLIVGSSGHVEISIANASAAERLGLTRLRPVELRPL